MNIPVKNPLQNSKHEKEENGGLSWMMKRLALKARWGQCFVCGSQHLCQIGLALGLCTALTQMVGPWVLLITQHEAPVLSHNFLLILLYPSLHDSNAITFATPVYLHLSYCPTISASCPCLKHLITVRNMYSAGWIWNHNNKCGERSFWSTHIAATVPCYPQILNEPPSDVDYPISQ